VSTMPDVPLTANDRLKASFSARMGGSLIVATVAHVLVFALWPTMDAVAIMVDREPPLEVHRLPETPLPDAPKERTRPAVPIASDDPDLSTVTIAKTDWESFPDELLPPPPDPDDGVGERSPFVTYTQAPRLTNAAEFQSALQRAYPAALRDAGISGTVRLRIHVDADGRVTDQRVEESSGLTSLDAAALRLTPTMRFSPAMNYDKKVAVWVVMPLVFQTR